MGRSLESCGFSNPAYFSRVFKKITGVSPNKYGAAGNSLRITADIADLIDFFKLLRRKGGVVYRLYIIKYLRGL